jgi:hypothetical protein
VTNRKANRAALSRAAETLANYPKVPEPATSPVCDATRAVLMGMQLQTQTIQEAQSAINRVVSAYNSTMQAIGALAARAENVNIETHQLDVDRMVWVERKK